MLSTTISEKSIFSFPLISLILVCSLGSPVVTAQEKKSESLPQTVEVSASGSVLQRQDDTAGKIIISRTEIVKYGDAALSDVLRRQPSVSVVGNSLRLHGLGNAYTQIMINGEPVPASFSIDSLSPESIERIEILRSSSAEYSAQAIGGSINFVLRQNISRGRKQIKLGLSHTAGRISPNVVMDFSDKDAGFSYSVSGSANRDYSEGDPVTTEWLRDSTGATTTLRQFQEYFAHDSTRLNLTPRLNWTLANGDKITSQSLLFLNHIKMTGNATENTMQGQSTMYPNNATQLQFKAWGVRSDLNWAHRFSSETKMDAKIGFFYSDKNRDQFFYGYAKQNTLPFIRNTLYDTIDQNWTFTGKVLWHNNDEHSFVFGWDGGLIGSREKQQQHDQDVSGNVPEMAPENFSADIGRLAFFAQDEWAVSKSLQAYLGVRWEGLRTRIRGNAVLDTARDSSVASPVMQLLWSLGQTKKDQLRLALSKIYKAPTPKDLAPYRQIINNDNGPYNSDYQGNPNLLPELATGLDLGYDHTFTQDGMLNISGFVRRVQNVVTNQLSQNNGVWITTPSNQGGAQIYGLEMDTKLPLRMFFNEVPAIVLRVNAARNWSRLDSVQGPDNRLANQVPITANFGVDYEATSVHTMGLNFNFQNGGRIKVSDVLSSYSGVTRTFDMFSNWKLSKASQLKVSLGNALHQSSVLGQVYRSSESSSRSTVTPTHTKLRLLFEHTL